MQLQTFTQWLLLSSCISLSHATQAQDPLLPPAHSSTSSLLSFHRSLVEHQSISNNEHGVASYLISYLRARNFTVETQPVAGPSSSPPRENILAYLGKTRQTRVLVSSHIDTVPPFWPYERRGDEIWGRGSVDAKGSIAAQVTGVLDLISSGEIEEGDVSLLFVVGEETDGLGMKTANDLGLEWETVIFGEPTELKLASGHKGIMLFTLTAKGKAAHSGYPELGRSANAMLVEALHGLMEAEFPWSEKYGNTTFNIGKIGGGVAANVVPEDASAALSVRIADGGPKDVEAVVRRVVGKLGDGLDLEFTQGYGPIDIDSDVPGFETIVVNYGTDIPNLKGSHKRFLYGPGSIFLAHSDHEHLKVSDLETAVEGYKTLIEHSLK